MIKYAIRQLLLLPVTLFGVSVLVFVMLQWMTPVERAALYVRDQPRNEQALEGVIRQYGLDQPLPLQYWHWLAGHRDPVSGDAVGGVLRGNLGYSRTAAQPVSELIRRRFPATVELALWSLLPVVGGGIALGVLSALHRNRLLDQLLRLVSLLGAALPSFVFALVLLLVFYARLDWLPPGRLSVWANEAIHAPGYHSVTHLVTIDALLNGRLDIFLDALKHLLLPVLALSFLSWAGTMRVTRAAMLEVLEQDYIVTARAKGLSARRVIRGHALPNALLPVTTLVGFQIAGLMGGAVIVETVFNYPGIGQAAAKAATELDIIAMLGFTLFFGFILLVANLIVDLCYGVLDPRVRLD